MSKQEVVKAAIATCGVASCLWKHEDRPSRIRLVVKTALDWFEVEVPIKLSYADDKITKILVDAIEAARLDKTIHGARFNGHGAPPRDDQVQDMFEVVA